MGKKEMFCQPVLVVLLALVTHTLGYFLYNDGCEISDNVAYKSTSFLDLIANISTVSQCSTLCRAHTGCTHWTLHKSGTYAGWCHLLGEVEHQIETQEAVSGNAECGDVTTTTSTSSSTTELTGSDYLYVDWRNDTDWNYPWSPDSGWHR